jgi:hypothetical protein
LSLFTPKSWLVEPMVTHDHDDDTQSAVGIGDSDDNMEHSLPMDATGTQQLMVHIPIINDAVGEQFCVREQARQPDEQQLTNVDLAPGTYYLA